MDTEIAVQLTIYNETGSLFLSHDIILGYSLKI